MPTYSSNFPSRPFRLELRVDLVSQNLGANQSTVSWSLWIVQTGSDNTFSFNTSSWSRNVDGQTSSGTFTFDFRNYSQLQLASGTRTVTHNSSGFYTVGSSASANVQVMGSTSVSGSFSLPRIPQVPGVPTNRRVDQVTSTSFRYRFDPGAENGASILENQVQRATNSSFSSPTTVSSNGSTTFTGLAPATYWVRARSRNSAGWGNWSPASQVDLLLPAPTFTSWEQNDTGGLVATWTAPSITDGLVGYRVQVAENSNFTTGVRNYNVDDVLNTTITGLPGGRVYWARVAARTSAGVSTFSASLSTTLVLASGDLDGWEQFGTYPAQVQTVTDEGVRRGIAGLKQALWIEANGTGTATVTADSTGIQRTFQVEENRAYIVRAAITRGSTVPLGNTYRITAGTVTGGTATLNGTSVVPLPEVEVVADSDELTVRVQLAQGVSVTSGAVVSAVAVVDIVLLELPSEFPQRLQSTVYESTLANHFDLACNSVGATWHVDRRGVTHFLLPGSTRPVRAVFSDQRGAAVQEYQAVTAGYDTRGMVNRLEVTNQGIGEDGLADDVTITVTNVQSESRFGSRTERLNVNLYGEPPYENALQDRLAGILAANDEPALFVSAVRWNAQENLNLARQLEIGDRIVVQFNGQSQDSQVVAIDHTLTPSRWMVRLDLVRI